MVDVEQEPYPDAALVCREQRGEHERAGVALEPDVVERELEALARVVEERRNLSRDLGGRLPAVCERPQLDRHVSRRVRGQAPSHSRVRQVEGRAPSQVSSRLR